MIEHIKCHLCNSFHSCTRIKSDTHGYVKVFECKDFGMSIYIGVSDDHVRLTEFTYNNGHKECVVFMDYSGIGHRVNPGISGRQEIDFIDENTREGIDHDFLYTESNFLNNIGSAMIHIKNQMFQDA